jgi:steroid delta-isomerase-like uncharacterized protein
VHDGPEAVASFLEETMRALPDMEIELHRLRHSEDAVFVEVTFHGTHLGTWRGLPPTGKRIAYRMCNVFEFEGDNLVCERLYFDLLTSLRQVGIARDPTTPAGRIATLLNHPLTVLKAMFRSIQ